MLTKILFRLFNPLQKIGYFSVEICLAWVFSEMLAVPHAHQAKILRHPHNENFTFLQLFMKIPLIFSFLGC
ncbi:hypothetical protein COM95_16080 [Bacillus cereus]|nr:hypothetical protein COM95_16080 [Bacillus cereus]